MYKYRLLSAKVITEVSIFEDINIDVICATITCFLLSFFERIHILWVLGPAHSTFFLHSRK